ncbi:MAG: alpha/beta hydrolase [Spirochaetia bacterium]|nr:alpha/beta hydrolase [Spirochaetia bacterium]
MEYFKFGSGKKTFVIIPGISLKSIMPQKSAIANMYSKFAEKYTIYLFDREKELKTDCTVMDMAEDTARAMKELGLSNACITGASQGGMIALYLAAYHPELVYKAVIAGSASRCTDHSKVTFQRWIRYAEKKDIRSLIADFCKILYTDNFCSQFQDSIIAANMDATEHDLKHFIILCQACIDFDFYNELDAIKRPLLVLGADKDTVFGPNASVEIAEKTGCQSYIYKNYKHAVYDEAPDFLQRMLDFFAS